MERCGKERESLLVKGDVVGPIEGESLMEVGERAGAARPEGTGHHQHLNRCLGPSGDGGCLSEEEALVFSQEGFLLHSSAV